MGNRTFGMQLVGGGLYIRQQLHDVIDGGSLPQKDGVTRQIDNAAFSPIYRMAQAAHLQVRVLACYVLRVESARSDRREQLHRSADEGFVVSAAHGTYIAMTGVTFNAAAVILPEGTKLRLLRDRVLIRPLAWHPSKIIEVVRHGRALRGVVEQVGPGRYYRRYRPHPTDARKRQFVDGKTFIPTEVKPGDVVELGGLNAYDGQGYNFPQVTIGTETFLICQEQDVCFVDETERCCEKATVREITVCDDCHDSFGFIPS